MKRLHLWIVLVACVLGCGARQEEPTAQAPSAKRAAEMEVPRQDKQDVLAGGGAKELGAPVDRKIKYTAEVRLVVEDFARAQGELLTLVKAQKGYVARSDSGGSPGSSRYAQWTVRIPVEKFDAFREAVAKL